MTFQYLIMANYHLYQRLMMKRLRETGLTVGQPKVLDYLYSHDGASQREIASACYIEPASLSAVLDSMEAKGIVQRQRRNGDRRSYTISMTEKGRELCDLVQKTFSEIEEEVIRRISGTQREEIEAVLSGIHHSLEDIAEGL